MFIFKLNTYFNRCGQERFRSIAKSYFRRADGVVNYQDGLKFAKVIKNLLFFFYF